MPLLPALSPPSGCLPRAGQPHIGQRSPCGRGVLHGGVGRCEQADFPHTARHFLSLHVGVAEACGLWTALGHLAAHNALLEARSQHVQAAESVCMLASADNLACGRGDRQQPPIGAVSSALLGEPHPEDFSR